MERPHDPARGRRVVAAVTCCSASPALEIPPIVSALVDIGSRTPSRVAITLGSNNTKEGRVTPRADREELAVLIEKSKKIQMTRDEETRQRRSFAYGNAAFENPNITQKMVDEEAEKIGL